MQHIYNYIIKISHELNETFKTESGFELYGHKDFSKDRLSNRRATIVSHPVIFDGELIDIGTEVIIDPSVYYHSIHGHNDKLQITTNTIDRDEGLYSIEPQNIVLYKKDGVWHGYLENFLAEQIIEEKKETLISGIITQLESKVKTNRFDAVYLNGFLKEQEVKEGDRLIVRPDYGVSVWIDGKEFTWLRNTDVLAKYDINGN